MSFFERDDPRLPSDHPLAGCEAKYWRAHEHFETLQDRIQADYASGESKFVTFRGELDPQDESTFRYVVDTLVEPGLAYAPIIGDIVHNIRPALDHLVFELAFLGHRGKKIPYRPAFPNSDTRRNWDSKIVQNKLLAGVLKKHRALLYAAQPCYRKQDSASAAAIRRRMPHPADDLDNLWNYDKHRMLQPPLVVPLSLEGNIISFDQCEAAGRATVVREYLARPLELNSQVLRIPIRVTGPNPYVDVRFQCTGDIWFRNRMGVLDSIAGIADWVGRVLNRFEREFETPTARQTLGTPQGWLAGNVAASRPC